MGASSVFFGILVILTLFNGYVAMIDVNYVNTLTTAILTTAVSGLAIIVVALGFQFSIVDTGWSFSETSISFIIKVSMILSLLFRIDLPVVGSNPLPLGIGLYTTVYNVFATNDIFGYGNILIYITGILCFMSGMIMVADTGGA